MNAQTPTQRAIADRRRQFQRSIARHAAELEAAKQAAREALKRAEEAAEASALAEMGLDGEELPPMPRTPGCVQRAFGPTDPPAFKYPNISEIKARVAAAYNINPLELDSARRTANVVFPRQVCFYLCKELTLNSLPAIGRHFGGRDHTTILHGHRKVARMLREDESLAHEIALLIEQLTAKRGEQ